MVMRRWYAILRCEATTITRERTYQDARDRDILFWWCESMSLFFYDVRSSSKLKLVFHAWNSRWRKNCRFCSCKNLFFFSPLLHSLCTFYLLSLRSTIADDDEKRRERKTIVSCVLSCPVLTGSCFSSSFHAIVVFTPLLFRHHELFFITSIES